MDAHRASNRCTPRAAFTASLLFISALTFYGNTAYNIKTPWGSKAISPVALTFSKDLPPFVLLADGKATCDIVIPASGDNTAYYKEVAGRLKYFLDAATGVSFSIVTSTSRESIFIGPSPDAFVNECYAKCDAMPPESLTVTRFSKGIVLAGNDSASPVLPKSTLSLNSVSCSRGTLFAVADFLERMLGFRFYFPGDMGMFIPTLRGTIEIPAVTYSDSPVFSLRSSSYPYYDTLDAAILKADKNARSLWDRMLRAADVNNEVYSHTDMYWHEVYAKDHPEFFALRPDGSRSIGDRGISSSQRCYANEAGFQEHLRIIERAVNGETNARLFNGEKQLPNRKYIYWWPNDGYQGCSCDACMKLTDNSPPYGIYSRIIWDYALRLSKAVAQKWPDRILKVPVYPNYGTIPENISVPDNVTLNVVKFGTGRFPAAYLKEPAYWQDAIDEVDMFNRRSKQKIWIWVHYPHSPRIRDSVMIPYPVPHFMQRYLSLNCGKIIGMHLNGHQMASFAFDGLMIYLWQKLLWNPDIDIDALIDEYALLWGPAAGEMKEFQKLLIDRWENVHWDNIPLPKDFDFNMPRDAVWERTYPKDVRARLRTLLDAAVARTAAGTIYAARANYLREGFTPFFESGERFDQKIRIAADAVRITPVIDGQLDEWNEPFTLADNRTGKSADTTRIFTGADDTALYIAGSALQDTPFRTLPMKRDAAVWNNDSIEIFLCAARDGLKEAGLPLSSQYHHIIFDSAGAVYDAYKDINAKKEDARTDIDLTLKTRTSPGRVDFELKVPFASLGVRTPAPGTEWLLNVCRSIHGKSPEELRTYAWSPTLGSFHQPERSGMIVFPRPMLWEKQFSSASDSFRADNAPELAQVTMENADGACRIHVTTPKDSRQKNIFFVLNGIPAHTANTHLIVEWKYQISGTGLKRITSFGADKDKAKLDYYIRDLSPADRNDAPSIIRHEFTKEKTTLTSINYFAIAVVPLAGADFTLTVDYVRAFDADAK